MNHAVLKADPLDAGFSPDAVRARVLVVDDQPLNIALVRQFLSDTYEVLSATRGAEALELCRTHKPDLILLDVMMPEMSGYEVCNRLKGDQQTRHVPVIFITSNFGPDEEAHGLSLGAVDFIAKPLNPEVLKSRVQMQLVIKHQADQALYLAAQNGKRQRQFGDAVNGRVGMCVIDVHGVFRDVNAGYCALYGYAREELLGQLFTLIFAPEDRRQVLALHDKFMHEGGELMGSWHAVRKDGSRVQITSESIRVPGDGDHYNRLVYVSKSDSTIGVSGGEPYA